MTSDREDRFLFREPIENPYGPQKSPWHVVVTSVFPDRVGITNPNGKLSARAEKDELLRSPEVPLLRRSDETITLPQDVIGRLVEVIESVPEPVQISEVNPFET